jgi:para-nitrobenzyl esterase
VPLLIGYNRTEETLFHRPVPDLDEAGLRERVAARVRNDPERVIAAYREAHPRATPWDLYMLIGTDHPRGAYSRELAARKTARGGAPAYLYRFDWETPVGGGHLKSPHAVEIPFVFNNLARTRWLTEPSPAAQALADKVSAAWVAFARHGVPATAELPGWPPYSAATRATLLLNTASHLEYDPDPGPRRAIEELLQLD